MLATLRDQMSLDRASMQPAAQQKQIPFSAQRAAVVCALLGFRRGGPLLPSGPIQRTHARCALLASPGLAFVPMEVLGLIPGKRTLRAIARTG
jgi:hypothetical protein